MKSLGREGAVVSSVMTVFIELRCCISALNWSRLVEGRPGQPALENIKILENFERPQIGSRYRHLQCRVPSLRCGETSTTFGAQERSSQFIRAKGLALLSRHNTLRCTFLETLVPLNPEGLLEQSLACSGGDI